jgi:glycerol-3-phosphate dehydrogenase
MIKSEFTGDLSSSPSKDKTRYTYKLLSRDENIKRLSDPSEVFDLLIIGGGASGAGVALDAASRGLKCAVVDSYDFASGTSSRSTKMAHGGMRYFEQMMFLNDPVENFRLLKETLHERNYFLHAAPYMNKEL